jgi:pimeloyl-ACP methyl ester carboxylesterase
MLFPIARIEPTRLGFRVITISLILLFSAARTNAQEHAFETLTCGLQERIAFSLWRRATPNTVLNEHAAAHDDIYKVTFPTADGRTLGGVYLKARGQPRGAILVIQGNAWTATGAALAFLDFRQAGFDVYAYDFRGYPMSRPGTPRLRAILEDYRAIGNYLLGKGYRSFHVYGFSFGGIIAIDALANLPRVTSIVVDSSPSRLGHGCPASVDPVNNLPSDARRIVLITGGRDRVVRSRQMETLIGVARARGAMIWSEPEWDHPFQRLPDSPSNARQRRLLELFRERS